MKPILVFSHNYIDYNWHEIVEEQLSKLVRSGLYDSATEIYYGAYANDYFQLYKFINVVKFWDLKNKIRIVIHPFNDGEKQTMILLQEVVKNYKDANVLYYHTKGITSLMNHVDDVGNVEYKNIESWRHVLEYFNIELWNDCINTLDEGINTCGALYVSNGVPWNNYFSGNFWWTTAKYIHNLPDMKFRDNRMGCELWIGQQAHTWANFWSSKGGSVYQEYFDPKEYRKDLDTQE
jgi:hypothetical protein